MSYVNSEIIKFIEDLKSYPDLAEKFLAESHSTKGSSGEIIFNGKWSEALTAMGSCEDRIEKFICDIVLKNLTPDGLRYCKQAREGDFI